MNISINNVNCFVENALSSELEKINKALTCFAPGYRYNQLFRRQLWDGKVRLFKNNSFPTGCLSIVLNNVSANLIDERSIPVINFKKSTNISLRDYQLSAINKVLSNKYKDLYWPRGTIKAYCGAGKTIIAAAIIQVTNLNTLFIVNQQELLKQAVDTFTGFGIETGTSIDEKKKVTVLTIQSLMQFGHKTNKKTASGNIRTSREVQIIKLKKQIKEVLATEYLTKIEQIFVDEAHGIASTLDKGNLMYQALALMPNAFMRWGLTATPFERDNYSNLLLEGATGSVIVEITAKELIEKGYLSAPEITMYANSSNEDLISSWPECYNYGIVLNKRRNDKIVSVVNNLPKPCIILVTRKNHGSILEKKFKDLGIYAPFISGAESKETRQKAIRDLKSNKLEIAIATKIWKQGLDIPNLQAIVLAAGGGDPVGLKQVLGRGMRIAEGKNKFQFVDFFDSSPDKLRKHSNARKRTWKSEGYAVRMEYY